MAHRRHEIKKVRCPSCAIDDSSLSRSEWKAGRERRDLPIVGGVKVLGSWHALPVPTWNSRCPRRDLLT